MHKLFLVLLIAMLPLSANAEIHRSQKAKAQFKQLYPCPATGRTKGSCPGYIIDHIIPLACDGADSPENMQWQTKSEAKQKDKWERRGC